LSVGNIYLICAMISGRLFSIIDAYLVSLTLAPQISTIAYVVSGLSTAIPGMIIQLIFIPILVSLLLKNKEVAKAIA
jgi:hypothetical protein